MRVGVTAVIIAFLGYLGVAPARYGDSLSHV